MVKKIYDIKKNKIKEGFNFGLPKHVYFFRIFVNVIFSELFAPLPHVYPIPTSPYDQLQNPWKPYICVSYNVKTIEIRKYTRCIRISANHELGY